MERLHKVLAQAGVAARRRAEEMIAAGRVRVNGKVVTELGTQVDPATDTIHVDNQPVALESQVYYLLNKPRGYISDRDETGAYKTALDLVPDDRRMFAAGRLDLMSEGLLLVTNDGELANRLTHPRYEHEKEYLALVAGDPDAKALERLERGVLYEGEWMRADRVLRAPRHQPYGEAGHDETWLKIILHEGKKRQIRHMCAAVGHPVKRLIRVRIGSLVIGRLKPGESRKLTAAELAQLREATQPRPRGRPRTRPTARYSPTDAAPRPASPSAAARRAPRAGAPRRLPGSRNKRT